MVGSKAVEKGTPTVACKLLGQEFMQRKSDISNALFRHATEVVELQDGFAFRFAGFDPWAARIMEFISVERECCPFFRFDLIVEPNQGPVQLTLRGSHEVKTFVLGELGITTLHVTGTT